MRRAVNSQLLERDHSLHRKVANKAHPWARHSYEWPLITQAMS